MMEILGDLAPMNRLICSPDYDKTIEYLKALFPLAEISFQHDTEHNGWRIPSSWNVEKATISSNGKVIYDGTWHPMAVIAMSEPFQGLVTRDELIDHLHYDHRYENSIPFHFRQQFRPWDRTWGFCVPKTFYDSLTDGDYEIEIVTAESESSLRMLEWTLPGKVTETFVFGANLDHPAAANDGISGVVVGLELFRQLAERQLNFSYRLVLTQGIIGSEFYLGMSDQDARSKIIEGIMLEMIGSAAPLALQLSRSGASNLDFSVAQALLDLNISHRTAAFEEVLLNDEYIWEAYGIPMTSLSRFPYPEYHSSRDDASIIQTTSLTEAVRTLARAVELLDSSPLIYKRFDGNVCLSNPEYNLYIDPGQIALGDHKDDAAQKMRKLMDLIPTLSTPVTVRQLALEVELPIDIVTNYLRKWKAKGLIDFRPDSAD